MLSYCYFGDYDDFLRDQHRTWGDYVYAAEKRPASNRAIKKYTQPDLKLNTDKHVIKRTRVARLLLAATWSPDRVVQLIPIVIDPGIGATLGRCYPGTA